MSNKASDILKNYFQAYRNTSDYVYFKDYARWRKKECNINTYIKKNQNSHRICKCSTTFRAHKLIYCPTCGKKLVGRNKKEKE